MVILTISDAFTDSRYHLVDRRMRIGFHWFVGICITSQVFSEVTMVEIIKEIADSYTEEGDEPDKFWLK